MALELGNGARGLIDRRGLFLFAPSRGLAVAERPLHRHSRSKLKAIETGDRDNLRQTAPFGRSYASRPQSYRE